MKRVGGGRERAVLGDLAQDAQAAGVDHEAKLTNLPRNVYSLCGVVPGTIPSMPTRSAALLVLVAAVWGVNFVLIHVGLEHFPPLLFTALRFTCMALPAVFFVGRPRVAWKWVLAFGFLLGVVKFGLLFLALDLGMPPGLSSLLLQVQVIFTVLITGVVLAERPRRARCRSR